MALCHRCYDKLDLEKCTYNEGKQEYHLVWKYIEDATKYPSILRDCDIMNTEKQYKPSKKMIYASTENEVSNDIIKELKSFKFKQSFI